MTRSPRAKIPCALQFHAQALCSPFRFCKFPPYPHKLAKLAPVATQRALCPAIPRARPLWTIQNLRILTIACEACPLATLHHKNFDQETANLMEGWRQKLHSQIQTENASMEEEARLWEQAICNGPLSFQSISSWQQKKCQQGGGSTIGKKPNKDKNRECGHVRILEDYFIEHCTYDSRGFLRRFRMTRRRFDRILSAVIEHDPYFHQKRDVANKLGLSRLQKVTAALRQLAFGIRADATNGSWA